MVELLRQTPTEVASSDTPTGSIPIGMTPLQYRQAEAGRTRACGKCQGGIEDGTDDHDKSKYIATSYHAVFHVGYYKLWMHGCISKGICPHWRHVG